MAPRSVPLPCVSLFSSRLLVPLWRMSISSSSTPLPKWVTVASRHQRRRSPSWAHSRRIAKLSPKRHFFEPTFKNGNRNVVLREVTPSHIFEPMQPKMGYSCLYYTSKIVQIKNFWSLFDSTHKSPKEGRF